MSRYLLQEKRVLKKFYDNKLLVLLDYDGTLVPITKTPEDALLPESAKDLIMKINKIKKIKLGVISGRSLKDIKKKVGINDLIYAGNHGLEWQIFNNTGKLISIQNPRKKLTEIKNNLQIVLNKFKGVLLEDKKYSLAIHYRLVDDKLQASFRRYLRYIILPYIKSDEFLITSGKKVYELKPNPGWNKGEFVEFLTKTYYTKKKYTLIYMGDDKTDEDVFIKFKNAVTIKVGIRETNANYYLKNQQEVIGFLRQILKSAEAVGFEPT